MCFSKRARRLRKIKSLRKIRDEILKTDNIGRAKKLLYSYPGVVSMKTETGGMQAARTEIELNTGYTFAGSGTFSLLEATQNCSEKVYKHLTST